MRILSYSLIVSLLWTASAAALPLQAQRVALPAQLLHAGKKTTLLPKRPLDPGDRIITGRNGRAVLLLEDDGQLVLGDESELYIHSAEVAKGDRGALARLALMRGSLRLDSISRLDRLPQDMRLNVGTLRLRVLGAEVWANVEPGVSQTVCLMQGTVEIVSDIGNENLDSPGDCFRYGANNVRMRLRPDTDATLARKLARTAFSGELPPSRPPVAVAAPQEVQQAPTPIDPTTQTPEDRADAFVAASPAPAPLPPPEPVQPPAPPEPVTTLAAASPVETLPRAQAEPQAAVAANNSVPANDLGNWTVVIASVKNAAGAEREASRLIGKGLPAIVNVSSAGFHRVCIGRFETREAARARAALLRSSENLKGWVAELQ